MRGHFKTIFYRALTVLFSIATACGPINPLNMDYADHNTSSSPIVLLIQLFFIIVLLTIKQPLKQKLNPLPVILFITIFALSTISNLINSASPISIQFWISFLKLIACAILAYQLPKFFATDKKLISYSFVAFSSTCIIISSLFLFGFLNNFVYWYDGRAWLFNENPNSTSTRYVIAILFNLYFFSKGNLKRIVKLLLLISSIPLFYAIIASGSRGSFIILIIGCLTFLIFNHRIGSISKVITAALATIAFVLLIQFFINQNDDIALMERLNDTYEYGDDAGRSNLTSKAKEIYLHNPFFGVGAIRFTDLMEQLYFEKRTVHNLYWYALVTTGIVGFSFFLWFILLLFKRAISVRKFSPICITLLISILMTAYKTGGALTYITMWYIFGIVTYLSDNITDKICERQSTH